MPWSESLLLVAGLLSPCELGGLGFRQRRRAAMPSADAAAADHRIDVGRMPDRPVAGHDSRLPAVGHRLAGWARHAGTGPSFVGETTHFAASRVTENFGPCPLPSTLPGQDAVAPVDRLPSLQPNAIAEPAATPAPAWDVGFMARRAVLAFGVAVGIVWWLVGMAALVRIIWTARAAPPRCRQLLAEIAGRRGDRVRLLTSRLARQPFACAWGLSRFSFRGLSRFSSDENGTVPLTPARLIGP